MVVAISIGIRHMSQPPCGKWTLGKTPPYGYECDKEGNLFESDVEQHILRLFRELSETLSMRQFATYLNEHGFQTRQGKPWKQHSVWRDLSPSGFRYYLDRNTIPTPQGPFDGWPLLQQEQSG
jgi:hypothetical protein